MTCIAAIADGETVWMGGDSASVYGDAIELGVSPKVVRNGQFLIGCAGDSRYTQIVRHVFEPPPYEKTVISAERFLAVSFIGTLRQTMKDHGYMRFEEGRERTEGCMLVGFSGRLFYISSCLSFVENIWKYDAIGSGQDVALGVFYGTLPADRWRPYERIHMALEAASRHSVGVCEPYTIMANPDASD